jgi:menaquinone-9 beta-reductase
VREVRRVLVIGAGPAGSSAAITLARAGFVVTLVEARPFPRAKVCGEFLSPAALPILESLLGRDALGNAGARIVDTFVLERGGGDESWPLPTPGLALSRGTLDALLRDAAVGAGARLVQPCLVRGVEYRDGGAQVQVEPPGGAARRVEVDTVVHADGVGRHDPRGRVRLDPRLIGFKCHFKGAGELAGVRIRACRGAYVGTIRVEQGLATCALVADRRLVARHRGDADALVSSLWDAFDPTRRVGRWHSCGIPRSGYRRPGHPRSFRVGNAAAAVDPVGGEGIGLALWAGTTLGLMLADHMPATLEGFGAVERAFAALYAARLRTRLPACRVAGWALQRPALVATAGPVLTLPRVGMEAWFALTGKHASRRAPATVGPC